jgi:hypothetical protein
MGFNDCVLSALGSDKVVLVLLQLCIGVSQTPRGRHYGADANNATPSIDASQL